MPRVIPCRYTEEEITPFFLQPRYPTLAMLLPFLHRRITPKRLERIYKLFFLCTLTGGEAATSLETDAVDFFPLDDLPPLSLGRTLPDDITLLEEYLRAPDRPCYFD